MKVIESRSLTYLFGLMSFSGNAGDVKAVAIYPFIIVKDMKFASRRFINHELIHFEQQKETLFIGLILMHIVEIIYYKFIRRLSSFESYKLRASEQEAYLNQDNTDYIKTRKRYAFLEYLQTKTYFKLESNGSAYII